MQGQGDHNEDMIGLEYIPFPNPDVYIQEETGGSAVLVSFDSGHAVSLNNVGRFIWQAADGNSTIAEIIELIRASFEGVPESVTGDVLEMVTILKFNGYFGEEYTVALNN